MKKHLFLIPALGLMFACSGEPNESEKTPEQFKEQIEVIEKTTQKLDESIKSLDSDMKKKQSEIDSLLNDI